MEKVTPLAHKMNGLCLVGQLSNTISVCTHAFKHII